MKRFTFLMLFCVLLVGCATTASAPVVEGSVTVNSTVIVPSIMTDSCGSIAAPSDGGHGAVADNFLTNALAMGDCKLRQQMLVGIINAASDTKARVSVYNPKPSK